eukprot:21347-Heterococcus_DN1.PRE.2
MQQQQYLQKVHVCAGSATCSSATAVASIAAAAAAGSADGTATAVSSVSESTAGDASAVAAAVAADTVVVLLVNTASSSGCIPGGGNNTVLIKLLTADTAGWRATLTLVAAVVAVAAALSTSTMMRSSCTAAVSLSQSACVQEQFAPSYTYSSSTSQHSRVACTAAQFFCLDSMQQCADAAKHKFDDAWQYYGEDDYCSPQTEWLNPVEVYSGRGSAGVLTAASAACARRSLQLSSVAYDGYSISSE